MNYLLGPHDVLALLILLHISIWMGHRNVNLFVVFYSFLDKTGAVSTE